jgi:ABC-type glycerol-3-phosphate transport system substrate-binding protein
MITPIREALTYRGKLYSLPYNCGVKSMAGYNSAILQEAGIGKEDLPKSWDELYDMCSRMKKDGVAETAIVMMWVPNSDGIVHNWQAESMNRGDPMWNEDLEPVFDENSGAALTLAAWNRLWTEQLVPTDNLVLGFVDARGVFATGTVPFITLQQWHFKTLNDPQQGNVAGKFMPIPYAGQPWGLLDYAGYAVVKQEDPLRMARAARWVDFMGYRDKNGEVLVGKQWVTCCGVGTAYPEAYNYPDVEASYKAWMPEYPYVRDVFTECLAHVSVVAGWKALWYPEWGTYVATVLPDAITGKRSVPEVIKDLKDKWNEFRSMYVA